MLKSSRVEQYWRQICVQFFWMFDTIKVAQTQISYKLEAHSESISYFKILLFLCTPVYLYKFLIKLPKLYRYCLFFVVVFV